MVLPAPIPAPPIVSPDGWHGSPEPHLFWDPTDARPLQLRRILLQTALSQRAVPAALGLEWLADRAAWLCPSPVHLSALRCWAPPELDAALLELFPNLPPAGDPPRAPLMTRWDQHWLVLGRPDDAAYFTALGWRQLALGQLSTSCPIRARLAGAIADRRSRHELARLTGAPPAPDLPAAPALTAVASEYLFVCGPALASLPGQAGFRYDPGRRLWHSTDPEIARQLATYSVAPDFPDADQKLLAAIDPEPRRRDHVPIDPPARHAGSRCAPLSAPTTPAAAASRLLAHGTLLIGAAQGTDFLPAVVRAIDGTPCLVLAPPLELRGWADLFLAQGYSVATLRSGADPLPESAVTLASIDLAISSRALRAEAWSLLLIGDVQRIGDEATQRTTAVLRDLQARYRIAIVPESTWDAPQLLWPILNHALPSIFADRAAYMAEFQIRNPITPPPHRLASRDRLRQLLRSQLLLEAPAA